MTDFPVTALRSVDLNTPDLSTSLAFYINVWGLEVVSHSQNVAYLRASGADAYILALHRAHKTELRAITFRCRSDADRNTILSRAKAAGLRVSDPKTTHEPGGGTIASLNEPGGGLLRFVVDDTQNPDARDVANRPNRLAHVNVNSQDVDKSAAFYKDILGFRLTDRSKMMAFMCCNADHHAIVIADAPVHGLNHIAFLLPDLESVMRASGRMIDHGFPIAWGVGRHGPGDNVFAYFIDPVATVIEYTAEVLQVDETYVFKGPDEWIWPKGRTDHWGIAPPKTEPVKQAQLAILHAGLQAGSTH